MRGTVLPALMVFAAYFLLLYAGVGFLQDKRFFGSAPKENLAAIPDRKERFPGAHAIGWALAMAALLLFLGAAALAVWDGLRRGFGFGTFFGRFLGILCAMEVYDIVFFDWVLLCHSNFFPHFYPELKGVVGPRQFGYNKASHLRTSRSTSPRAPWRRGSARSFEKERRDRNGHAFLLCLGQGTLSIGRGLFLPILI